ncbi:hypothetical protein [Pseudomonas sp. LB-090624]|nr:hypothetical protein [Pseudomonas sp. LB-090624]
MRQESVKEPFIFRALHQLIDIAVERPLHSGVRYLPPAGYEE